MGLFIIHILCFLKIWHLIIAQNSFDCDVPEPSTRFMHLRLTPNITELSDIDNGEQLDPNLTTFIIVHGWREWPTKQLNLKLARTLAKHENSNVLLMDYSKWTRKFYNCAIQMVEAAGNALSEFIISAVNQNYTTLDKIHLIGHSLGAHVSGVAGKIVNEQTNQSIHRITGLDPAGPLFAKPFTYSTDLTLNEADAVIVDVLHTTVIIGTPEPLGTVDFYAESPYGSGIQAGCINEINIGCSHIISREYYIESIKSCAIRGFESESFDNQNFSNPVIFGHHMPENVKGIYKFTPRHKSPYGRYSPKCENNE